MQGQIPPSASGITRTANHCPLAIPGCRARGEEGKRSKHAAAAQQLQRHTCSRGGRIGDTSSPISAFQSSSFTLCPAISACRRQNTWAATPCLFPPADPTAAIYGTLLSERACPSTPSDARKHATYLLPTTTQASQGNKMAPPNNGTACSRWPRASPASQPIGARFVSSARVPEAGVGPCGGWDR